MNKIKVIFEPEHRSIYVLGGISILEAARKGGIIVEAPCGGQGTCGKCRVKIIKGNMPPSFTEKKILSKKDFSDCVRLACQSKVISSCSINIPESSRQVISYILTKEKGGEKEIKPGIWKKYVELKKPTLNDPKSNLDIIREAFNTKFHIDICLIRSLPRILKRSDYKITCVFSNNELINIEEGDTTGGCYGVAFDVGTTTLVATLLDLNTGKELAVTLRMNPQRVYGDDVVSRIKFAITEKKGLASLHQKITTEMKDMLCELVKGAGIETNHIYKIVVAGNSTMQHIILGITPQGLSGIPFNLVMREGIEIKAQKTGFDINPHSLIYVLPSIAGFVGGDTTSCILSTQIHKEDKLKLLIDIGTNGEIVLGNREKILAASTAAGPAFEGGRISKGMIAVRGAIEKVVISEDVEYNTIGNVSPIGICGTGLIDSVAEFLKEGIIDKTGRIVPRFELKGSEKIKRRIIETENGNNFLLVDGTATTDNEPILITQRDIRELQVAKSAIAAGIKILKKEMGVTDKDISEVYLAGAFGNSICIKNAKRIGLIPNIPSERITFVGNASSTGAKLALLSYQMRDEAEKISRNTQYIELSAKADFNESFMNEMAFP